MSASALFDSVSGSNALSAASLFNVSGWVAVVTGGGTGLGLVTATTLAENGCKVYITGRRLEPLQEAVEAYKVRKNGYTHKGEIIAVQADVSTKEGSRVSRRASKEISKWRVALIRPEFREAIEKDEKWINILVNNHGVSHGCADINACEQTPEGLSKQMFENENFDAWRVLSHYRINCASYHFTTFAFLPLLAAAKSVGGYPEPGNIVNLSSMSGITKTSQRGQFGYNASKAATISLSHMQAAEFARRNLGVRVNCICPGYFPSVSRNDRHPPDANTGSEAHTAEFRNKWGIPFGRPGSAVDYAQCIFSLVTNQYVTGAEVVIDGGWLLESAF
ncbi:hypothetical protein EHS25_005839 [Saitozyma podzolica]|uniref:NAD(P)-binding protein n=1 Tax=Saitozyma podzolica TaxID=1890683 RepID=A0A427XVE1_9TREE|nr:hypothetical protein EHS25_005839 [Saitozyma podzolica]